MGEHIERLTYIEVMYEEWIRREQNRDISYGEMAYIEGLDAEELDKLEEEVAECNEFKEHADEECTLDNLRAELDYLKRRIAQLRDELASLIAEEEEEGVNDFIKAYGWDEYAIHCIEQDPEYDLGYLHGYIKALGWVVIMLDEIEGV